MSPFSNKSLIRSWCCNNYILVPQGLVEVVTDLRRFLACAYVREYLESNKYLYPSQTPCLFDCNINHVAL